MLIPIMKNLKVPALAAFLALVLLAAPAREAVAWNEVCVKVPLGQGVAGHIYVIHGFRPNARGQMPAFVAAGDFKGEVRSVDDYWRDDPDIKQNLDLLREQLGDEWAELEEKIRSNHPRIADHIHYGDRSPIKDVFDESLPPARAAPRSDTANVNQTRCVNIRNLRNGEPFYVLFNAHGKSGRANVLCTTHSSNRNWWYPQRSRPFAKIFYQGGGSVWDPWCRYWKEDH